MKKKKAPSKALFPLSAETPYRPGMFPRRRGNCYAFALGKKSAVNDYKLQPGEAARVQGDPSRSCKNLKTLMAKNSRAGNVGMYKTSATAKCRQGYRRIAGVLDKGADYHFFRMMRSLVLRPPRGTSTAALAKTYGVPASKVTRSANGRTATVHEKFWSHKRGLATGAILRDSKGALIRDPRRAARDYGALNYNTFCGFYCVGDKKGKGKKNAK